MASPGADIGRVFGALRGRQLSLRNDLGETDHRIQGRAQLVAHIGEEVALGAARLLRRLHRQPQLRIDLYAAGDLPVPLREGLGERGVLL